MTDPISEDSRVIDIFADVYNATLVYRSDLTSDLAYFRVKMDGPAMEYFLARRVQWAAADLFSSPGPRQLWGPAAYQQPISVALNSASESLAFKIG